MERLHGLIWSQIFTMGTISTRFAFIRLFRRSTRLHVSSEFHNPDHMGTDQINLAYYLVN